MTKLLLKIKSSFFSRKITSSLKLWALKVDINLLNQHCKPVDWMAEWLTDLLRNFGTQGTRGTWALEELEALYLTDSEKYFWLKEVQKSHVCTCFFNLCNFFDNDLKSTTLVLKSISVNGCICGMSKFGAFIIVAVVLV